MEVINFLSTEQGMFLYFWFLIGYILVLPMVVDDDELGIGGIILVFIPAINFHVFSMTIFWFLWVPALLIKDCRKAYCKLCHAKVTLL